jgi:adenine C2-methylase RlmN of 23S rRNA A2503 and tRNA A37
MTADIDRHISAYTTSVSSGCALTAAHIPCKFCRTGNTLRFSGPLSSQEIAMQNVFMVMSDLERFADDPGAGNLREFAYMGQGEPGFSYTQLRQAVCITDKAMAALGQKVFRHILATCGVVEMADALIHDLENNFFNGTRVTFHYSLHATQRRGEMMPIENIYSHGEIIKRLPRIRELTGEKVCVGILMFKDYCNGDSLRHYFTNEEEIARIAAMLDPEVCRISLCEFNQCDNVGTNAEVSPEEASRLASMLENKGFQVKLFASFGKQENTACGLLGGTAPDQGVDDSMRARYSRAVAIIESS